MNYKIYMVYNINRLKRRLIMLKRKIIYIALGLLTYNFYATSINVELRIDNYPGFCESINKLPEPVKNKFNEFYLQYNAEKKNGNKRKLNTVTQLNHMKTSSPSSTIKDYEYAAVQNIRDLLIDDGSDEAAKRAIELLNCLKDKMDNPAIKDDVSFCIGVLFYSDTFSTLTKSLDAKYPTYTKEDALALISSLKENNFFAQDYLDNL